MRQWLIDARIAKGLSQKVMSEAVGIAQPTYWEYEHGKCSPSPETAKKIAGILEFPWTQFFENPTGE